MYCVKCGVELADNEKKCPLCGTVVCHPDLKIAETAGLYPKKDPPHEEFNRQGTLFILTFIFLIPLLLTLICDLSINHAVVWSGFTAGALALGYIIIVLPMWFRDPNPVIFVPADFAAVTAFLWYINFAVGGEWFCSFALPLMIIITVITCSVVTLMKYVPRGSLYIFGGAFIASGLVTPVIERLINSMTGTERGFIWSFYPLAVFVLIGIMLIVVAVCRPLRESLKQRFFL